MFDQKTYKNLQRQSLLKKDKSSTQRQGRCTYQLTEFLWKMTYLAFQLQKARSNSTIS